MRFPAFWAMLALTTGLAACDNGPSGLSGYAEGDYVALAPAVSGRLLAVEVAAGDRLEAASPVARLDDAEARLAVAQAEARLTQASAALADLETGQRPEEIEVIRAGLKQAEAEALRASLEIKRAEELLNQGVASQSAFDTAHANFDVATAKVEQMSANLRVAQMPARPQTINLARARKAEAEAALATARWQLDQFALKAEVAGTVEDVQRHPGDMAGPSAPVITFLPDNGVKLRLYADADWLPRLQLGQSLAISCGGCPENLTARISNIRHEPEFTPPVIYSVERRQKLIYRVEARPEGEALKWIKPGQIVDARLP